MGDLRKPKENDEHRELMGPFGIRRFNEGRLIELPLEVDHAGQLDGERLRGRCESFDRLLDWQDFRHAELGMRLFEIDVE